MIQIRRSFACIKCPKTKQSRLRLYALFTGIVLFSAVTAFLNLMPYWVHSNAHEMPTVSWLHLMPAGVPVIKKIDSVYNESTHAPDLSKHPHPETWTVSTKQRGQRRSGHGPPHMVWDTSLLYTDRIMEQLRYIPKHRVSGTMNILVWQKEGGEEILSGTVQFKRNGCRVANCFIRTNMDSTRHADALITSMPVAVKPLLEDRKKTDVWIFYALESPIKFASDDESVEGFNWTATYRHDSTIVAPYEKWVPFENSSEVGYYQGISLSDETKTLNRHNYALGKRKLAAAVISNCGSEGRMRIISELSKYIRVDVYGTCGIFCPVDCFNQLGRDYKFYLAFENANCIDYITEKFFRNALG